MTFLVKHSLSFVIAFGLMAGLSACQQTAQRDVSQAFSTTSQAHQRNLDSRLFDTNDEATVLNAIVALLQDLGFKLDETDTSAGLVSASKLNADNSTVRVSVTTQPVKPDSIKVRATFQNIYPGRDPRYYRARNVSTEALYQDFFDKLSQSLFLEAHAI